MKNLNSFVKKNGNKRTVILTLTDWVMYKNFVIVLKAEKFKIFCSVTDPF